MDRRDAIRPRYKPNPVKVLLVGESLSASGTFFYEMNSNLYTYTQEAFSNVFGSASGTGQQFLRFFKELGFYFDDLCLEPVNHLPEGAERRKKRLDGVLGLSLRIKEMQPLRVIALMKKIEREIGIAAGRAGLLLPVYSIPFPAYGSQRRYVEQLSELLRGLIRDGIISSF